MSPEAVEALARNLAAKMESHKGSVGRLADQLVVFQEEDKAFKRDDAVFKREVRDSLVAIRRLRNDVPLIAIGLSLVACVMAAVSLIKTAQASQQTQQEVREIREHLGNVRAKAP